MSDEVEDFLAHYGIKGMKWGRRKAIETAGPRTRRPPLTPEQQAKRKAALKKAAVIAGSVVVVAGAAAVAVVIARNSRMPVSQIANAAQTNVGRDLLTLTRSSASSAVSGAQTSFGSVRPPVPGFNAATYARQLDTPTANIMGNTANMMNQFNSRYGM